MAEWKNFAVSVLGDAGGLLGAHGVAGKQGFLAYMQQMAARDQQRAAQNFTREMKLSDQMFAASEGRKNRQAAARSQRRSAGRTTAAQTQAQQQAINAATVRMGEDPEYARRVLASNAALGIDVDLPTYDAAISGSGYLHAATYVNSVGRTQAWKGQTEVQKAADRYTAAFTEMGVTAPTNPDAAMLAQTRQQYVAAKTAIDEDQRSITTNQAALVTASGVGSPADRLEDLQEVQANHAGIGEKMASREGTYYPFVGPGGNYAERWVGGMEAHAAQGQAINSEMRGTKKDLITDYNIKKGGVANWPLFNTNIVENSIELEEMLSTPGIVNQLAPANDLLASLLQFTDSEMSALNHGPGSGLWELRAAAINARNNDREFKAEGLVRDRYASLQGDAPSPTVQAATLGRLNTAVQLDSVSLRQKGTELRHIVADTANVTAYLASINEKLPPEYHLEHSADEIDAIRRQFGTPNKKVGVGDSLSPGGIDGIRWDADAQTRYRDSAMFRDPMAEAIWSNANAYWAAGDMGIEDAEDAREFSLKSLKYMDALSVNTKKAIREQINDWSGVAVEITGSVPSLYELSGGSLTEVINDGDSYGDALDPASQKMAAERVTAAIWGRSLPTDVEWEQATDAVKRDSPDGDSMTLFALTSFFRTVSPLVSEIMDRPPGDSPSAAHGELTGVIDTPGWLLSLFGRGETTLEGGMRPVEGTARDAIGRDFGVGVGSPDSTRWLYGDKSIARKMFKDGATAQQVEAAGMVDVIRATDLSEGAIGSRANQALAASMQAHLREMPDDELISSLITGGLGLSLSRIIPTTAAAPISNVGILDARGAVRTNIKDSLEEVGQHLAALENILAQGNFKGRTYDRDPGPGVELDHLNEAVLTAEIEELEGQKTGLEAAYNATITHDITSTSMKSIARVLGPVDSTTALHSVLGGKEIGGELGATEEVMKMEVKPWTVIADLIEKDNLGAENALRAVFGMFGEWGSVARQNRASQTSVPLKDRMPLLIEENRALEGSIDMILQIAADPQLEKKMADLDPSLHEYLGGDSFDRMGTETQDERIWKAARIWRSLVMSAQL